MMGRQQGHQTGFDGQQQNQVDGEACDGRDACATVDQVASKLS